MPRKLSIEILKEIAQSRKGKLLSNEYINSDTKYKWECDKGHIWEASANNIRRGTWCPFCRGKHKTIKDMQAIAEKRSGKCLSERYLNAKTKLLWQCNKGHKWEAIPDSIRRGSWCPYCSNKIIDHKKRLKKLNQYVKNLGGELLSNSFMTIEEKVKIRCKRNHIFFSDYDHLILQNNWCPYCSTNRGEEITRKCFELLFYVKFPKKKPIWLTNHKGNRLELDGFNEELNIAFEFHGIQHKKEIKKFFHKNKRFQDQKINDSIKRNICKNKTITLIEIFQPNNIDDIPSLIIKELLNNGYDFTDKLDSIKINKMDFSEDEYYERLKEKVKDKDGVLLTKYYKGSKEKHKFKCKNDHLFYTTAHDILQGRWCPKCGREQSKDKLRLGINYFKELAKKNGGKCLTDSYKNVDTKMEWQCGSGHVWEATGWAIKNGSWCPICNNRILPTIEDMRVLATQRGGFCLSEKYYNSHTKLLWQCNCGNTWEASPNNIKRGSWCPKCARIKRKKSRTI